MAHDYGFGLKNIKKSIEKAHEDLAAWDTRKNTGMKHGSKKKKSIGKRHINVLPHGIPGVTHDYGLGSYGAFDWHMIDWTHGMPELHMTQMITGHPRLRGLLDMSD